MPRKDRDAFVLKRSAREQSPAGGNRDGISVAMCQWPQLRAGGSTTLSLGRCLLRHHAACRARRDFIHPRNIELFTFLSSALVSHCVPKSCRVLEHSPSSHREDRLRFCVFNLTAGNLGLSGAVQQGSVPRARGFTEHSCKIRGQVVVPSVLCMECHRTL